MLCVSFPQWHPKLVGWLPTTGPVVPVLPGQVAHAIRLALLRGWNPENPGAPFRVSVDAVGHGDAGEEWRDGDSGTAPGTAAD